MAFLLAIEGADGAGKATATAAVTERLNAAGLSAAALSFPRYAETVGGWALGEYLAGRLPHAAAPETAATLYALDRFESRPHLIELAEAHDVIVFDRYIASNMAYQAAQVAPDQAPALLQWIEQLETVQFRLPAPHLSVYLDTPLDVARDLIARKRKRSYTDDTYDAYEADLGLQARVRANYAAMADGAMLGEWVTVSTVAGGPLRDPAAIADEITALATERLR